MSDETLRDKWDRRHAGTQGPAPPMEVLADNLHLLPRRGRALDLACGLGANALLLAARGLQTLAWDISPVAIERLQGMAGGLPLVAAVRDVERERPPEGAFDVICVGHFLERALCPAIAAALAPGGVLYYQTWTREKVDASGPDNPDFLLAPNELLRLFPGLTVRFYREEGRLGDPAAGFRNRAQLVAQRAETG
jgi:tellurite methyltransferase